MYKALNVRAGSYLELKGGLSTRTEVCATSNVSLPFKNVTKHFGNTIVVDDLSLDDRRRRVRCAAWVHLAAAKLQRYACLPGSETATSGDILINDERINDVPTQHRDLAMVFQVTPSIPHMTIAENIGYPLRVRKLDKQASRWAGTERVATLARD